MERVRIPIEDTLRNITQYPPLDWDKNLPAVEFAINNAVNLETGYTPFVLSDGQHPLDPVTVALGDSETPRIEDWKRAVDDAREKYEAAQRRRLDKLNSRRIDPMFRVGDMVLMHSKFLTWPGAELMGKKFNDRYMGPFRILRIVQSGNAAELDFSEVQSRIHPIIPVSRLEKFVPDNRFLRQHNQPTPRILHDGVDMVEVDALVNRRIRGTRYHYLVKYRGYGPEHNQWIPEIYIADSCRDLIQKYDQKYPR